MLPLVVTAAALWADLARPVSPEEHRRVIGQQALLHEPLSLEVRAYYLAKGQVLACFLHQGMTDGEVRRVLGVRADGWVRAGESWTDTYSLLGLTVRYRVAEIEVAGKSRIGLVVEGVQATSP
jgi:hypothetical protein